MLEGSGRRHEGRFIGVGMKLKASVIALIASTALAVPMALAAMPTAGSWEIGPIIRGQSYSPGMPTQPGEAPGGGPTFAFPQRGEGEMHALTTAVAPLAGARAITFRYRIEAPRGTRFVSAETPDQTATVSLYFQQRGDNWSARGRYGSYRWYSPTRAVIPLTPGERTVTVRLDETWTNVNGIPNTQDSRGYARALNDTARLGLAFGTLSARGHGVYTAGPARFTLLSVDMD